MAAAVLAAGHALIASAHVLAWEWRLLLVAPYLRAGLVALLVLLLLYLTSWPRIVSALRLADLWRRIHVLVHACWALIVVHVLFAPWAQYSLAVALILALIAVYGFRGLVGIRRWAGKTHAVRRGTGARVSGMALSGSGGAAPPRYSTQRVLRQER